MVLLPLFVWRKSERKGRRIIENRSAGTGLAYGKRSGTSFPPGRTASQENSGHQAFHAASSKRFTISDDQAAYAEMPKKIPSGYDDQATCWVDTKAQEDPVQAERLPRYVLLANSTAFSCFHDNSHRRIS